MRSRWPLLAWFVQVGEETTNETLSSEMAWHGIRVIRDTHDAVADATGQFESLDRRLTDDANERGMRILAQSKVAGISRGKMGDS